jgi:hypothetical protein
MCPPRAQVQKTFKDIMRATHDRPDALITGTTPGEVPTRPNFAAAGPLHHHMNISIPLQPRTRRLARLTHQVPAHTGGGQQSVGGLPGDQEGGFPSVGGEQYFLVAWTLTGLLILGSSAQALSLFLPARLSAPFSRHRREAGEALVT